jgi:hypothetical protein
VKFAKAMPNSSTPVSSAIKTNNHFIKKTCAALDL